MNKKAVMPAHAGIQYWIPAFAGMTMCLSALAADGLLPKKPGEQEFLPVEQAFEIQPLEWKNGGLVVSWHITKGYYLYQERMKFTPASPASLKLGAPAFPASEAHSDEYFGTTHVFHHDVHVRLPMDPQTKGPVSITVVYQGCADAGLCYPPQTRTLQVAR